MNVGQLIQVLWLLDASSPVIGPTCRPVKVVPQTNGSVLIAEVNRDDEGGPVVAEPESFPFRMHVDESVLVLLPGEPSAPPAKECAAPLINITINNYNRSSAT